MRFLRDYEFRRIKALADGGNEGAKDFLADFMFMPDADADAYLSKANGVADGGFKAVIEALIKDENEAIDGYDKAIKWVANSTVSESEKAKASDALKHIREEEIEHLSELRRIFELWVG